MDQQSAPTSSPFEQCPFEIAAHIASMKMERPDLLNLRLTSRRLCSLFTPLAFHHHKHWIRLSASGIANSRGRVPNQPAYSPIPTAFAPHITRLQVDTQAIPSYDAMESANTVLGADGNRKFGRLWEEISQLTSINWLGWAGHSEGSDDAVNAQLLILLDKTILAVQGASGERLQTIKIYGKAHYGLPNSLLHLNGLSNLMLICLLGTGPASAQGERQRALVSQIRSIIIRHRSTLQYIDLDLDIEIPLTLEDIFPPEAVELQLARVHLPRMQNSVPEALASVPKLCELHFTHNARPSVVDHIWDALRVHEIAVQETTNFATISHMKYLSSFSGLTTFSLTISSPVDPAIVNLFFNAVLPAQAASLETIVFLFNSDTPIYDGFVYSSRDQWFGRLSFPRLRHLEVYAPSDWDTNQSRCQSLVDDLQDFPALDIFSVQWSKHTLSPQAFGRGQFPLNTRTGRPSAFIAQTKITSYSYPWFQIEVGKSDG